MRPCNEVIQKLFELVDWMEGIADEGDMAREDVGCGILYGVLRDSAYKIRKMAEDEKQAHIRKGWWDGEGKGRKQPSAIPLKAPGGIAGETFES